MSEVASAERNWLEDLIREHGGTVTDAGFDFTTGSGDLVYERGGGRFEVTIKELPGE